MLLERWLSRAAAATIACTLTACTGAAAPTDAPGPTATGRGPTPAASPVGELRDVSIALNFQLQAYAAPMLWGEDQGYFAEEGIDLEVIPTTGGDQSLQMVNEGQAEFGITDLDPFLSAHIAGETDTTIVYVWLDQPTMGIVSTEPLESPASLEGTTFGTTQFSSGRTVVPFVMEANGADSSQLTVEALEFAVLYPSLFEGAIDSAELHRPGSWQNLKATAAEQGIEVHFVPLSEWGLRSYSKTVFVQDALIEEDPDLVASMVRALDRSLRDALENASGEEIFQLLDAADAQLPEEPTILDWEDVKEVVDEPGEVDPAVVQYVLDLIEQTRGVETDLSPEDVYTNEFVPEAS